MKKPMPNGKTKAKMFKRETTSKINYKVSNYKQNKESKLEEQN